MNNAIKCRAIGCSRTTKHHTGYCFQHQSMATVRIGPVCDEITAERRRQIMVERWTAEHDDRHATCELARAGACYALVDSQDVFQWYDGDEPMAVSSIASALWPWDGTWWKPRDARRNLIRAAALIVAEIERLDRITRREKQ